MDVFKIIKIKKMFCTGCERIISNAIKNLSGVKETKASYSKNEVKVKFDESILSIDKIVKAIEEEGYEVKEILNQKEEQIEEKDKNKNQMASILQLVGILVIIFAVYLIIKNTIGFNYIPQLNNSVSLGFIFVIGFFTSFHCIAMCGGINLSQCVSYKFPDNSKFAKLKPSLLYNLGRIISYTIIGGIVGGIGSVLSFSNTTKSIIVIIAAIFMVIMGLNMLNIFPFLKNINIKLPSFIETKLFKNMSKHGPFYVGLLNGLLPCGPLQTMQIYALGTGSIIKGALSMLFFSIGTVPLMFGFGFFATFLNKKFSNILMRVSAILVIVLGVIMLNRGLSFSGISTINISTEKTGIAKINGNEQFVQTVLKPNNYQPIIVQKGIKVKWTIKAEKQDINSCNESMIVPNYNIQHAFKEGDNVVEFMPDKEGTFAFSCWMGMITSNIKVVNDIAKITEKDIDESVSQTKQGCGSGNGGGCCGGGGIDTFSQKNQSNNFIRNQDIQKKVGIAKIIDGIQEITVNVNESNFDPNIVVLQKGVPVKFKFNPVKIVNCNSILVFPRYNGQLNLIKKELETPLLPVSQDFDFMCWMGMIVGKAIVVDDLTKVDMERIKKEVQF
ncbi:MAG: heavy metal transporter [Spirochaetes bacterium GWD1_27_9]|nr:MAG: heavy metal transporter [Spirochaetes bacterium GWB1_27_13]OHD27064.1 MAG: heavy metal transporter [Spirochaetes bacterium GWC1_27_15]OHD38375.1 MAG: heavy metal transporter [Spirochaetes bacterium GWD1_27_9]